MNPKHLPALLALTLLCAACELLPVLPAPTVARPQHPDDWTTLYDTAHRWDPCTPIPLVVHAGDAPPDGIATLAGVAAEITALTGLQFTIAITHTVPTHTDLTDRAVVVTWTATAPVAIDAGLDTDAVGLATAQPHGDHFIDGYVLLDRAYWDRSTTQERAQLTRHELGHLIGLGHAQLDGHVMYPTVGSGPENGTWGTGDLTGLLTLGAHC